MKRFALIILALALLLIPAAQASAASDVAADYEADVIGQWKCLYSDRTGFLMPGEKITFPAQDEYPDYEEDRFFVMASASGDAYLCYRTGKGAFVDFGVIRFSPDSSLMWLFDNNFDVLLERCE